MCGILAPAGAVRADQPVGDAGDASPGLIHLAVPTTMETGAVMAWSGGYGFRGETLDLDDSHHRLAGNLSLSIRPRAWLAAGLRLDGRHDRHSVAGASDVGWVGDPRLFARAHRVRGPLGLGIAAGLWFPAADPFSVAGASVEARGLASYRRGDLTMAANLGARLDRSAETIDDPDGLSLADRMALGASDADAVLLGAGVAWRRGALELAGEWTWDLLVGTRAPAISASPMRLSTEVRRQLRDRVWLRLGMEVSVSATPEVAMGAPLVPVEPRAALWIGASYRFGGPRARRGSGVLEAAPPEPPTPAVPGPVSPPEPALPPGQIRGLIRTLSGAPIAGARVRIEPLGKVVRSGEDGAFRLDVQPGSYTIEVRARGHAPQRRDLRVDENGVTVINVDLRRGGP